MRSFIFGLSLAFALGFVVTAAPVLAGCSDGHKAKTADIGSPNIADGQLPQTPKPNPGG